MTFRAWPHRSRVAAAAAVYLACTSPFLLPVGVIAGDGATEGELLVMLQGENLEAIRQATLASGAKITHDLPIISALGAQMSAAQLKQLQSQPFVERVIDDLAYEPDPELGGDEDCPMGGALHLKWQDSTASWRLFNKGSDALPLAALRASWPNELGELRALTLDGIAFGDAGFLPAKNDIEMRLVYSFTTRIFARSCPLTGQFVHIQSKLFQLRAFPNFRWNRACPQNTVLK